MHRKFLLEGALAVCIVVLSAGSALALDTFFVGPRVLGMAGANVASTSDTTAQYYNPAAFGFFGCLTEEGQKIACDNNYLGRKDWGLDLGAGLGYRIHNDLGQFLDDLADIDIDQLSQQGIQTQSDLEDLVNLVKDLSGLDEPGNAITADLNAGLAARYGHFAIGVRGYAQASGFVQELDNQNLGISVNAGDLNTDINSVTIDGNDGQTSLFTQEQIDQLTAAGLDADAIQKLDYIARQQQIDPALLQETVDTLDSVVTQSSTGTTGDLSQNTTTVLLTGFGLLEVPLSYGYALNDHWSVGGNLKLMMGRVYGTKVTVFDNDSGDVIRESDENYEESANFGVDLAVMGRYKYVNVGLVGRNLNSPEFDGFTDQVVLANGNVVDVQVDDVTLDPQFAVGVAFIPFETLTLEADYDLTENETALPGYETQNLSFGLEWDALRVLALRAGTYKNLSEDDIGWVYTAGLGLNLWAARLDIAGAFADEQEEFDGDEIPKETRLAAQLSVDF